MNYDELATTTTTTTTTATARARAAATKSTQNKKIIEYVSLKDKNLGLEETDGFYSRLYGKKVSE